MPTRETPWAGLAPHQAETPAGFARLPQGAIIERVPRYLRAPTL
jgi:hypothetical protein